MLSKRSTLIPTILHTYHDSVLGHSGFLRTHKRLIGELYWEGTKADVKKYCDECVVCQRNKTLALSPVGLIMPLEIPNSVWSDISMDFTRVYQDRTGLKLFVVVDRYSKYGHFLTLKHLFTAKTVAELFVKEIVRLHGYPKSIVSDRDTVFLSSFWKDMFKMSGTRLNHSTACHPQTDGQTEVVNRAVETYLRCFCSERPKEWTR